MNVTASEVIAQLHTAGLLPFLAQVYIGPDSVSGTADLAVLEHLRKDERFYEDIWNLLHPEIPDPKTGFRSYNGTLGEGSTQFVINTEFGMFHADVDSHNTQDLVNIGAHTFGKTGWVTNWFRKLWRRA